MASETSPIEVFVILTSLFVLLLFIIGLLYYLLRLYFMRHHRINSVRTASDLKGRVGQLDSLERHLKTTTDDEPSIVRQAPTFEQILDREEAARSVSVYKLSLANRPTTNSRPANGSSSGSGSAGAALAQPERSGPTTSLNNSATNKRVS